MAKEPRGKHEHPGEGGKKEKDKKTESETVQSRAESKNKKKKERDEESVILMGPAYTEEENTMQSISDVLPDLFKEESAQGLYGEPPTVESQEIHHHQGRKRHRFVAPRFFLGVVFIFVGVVYLGRNLELFDTVNVDVLKFWPLILIFFGLVVVYFWKGWGKIIGVASALLVVVIVFSMLFGDGRIIGGRLSGNIIEEKREAAPFTSIVFLGAGNLVIKQGKEVSLTVKADASIIDSIKTEVLDGELRLSASRSLLEILLYRKAVSTYLVTVTDLEAVYLTGSGSVQSTGINADKLELSIRGSGNVEMNDIRANEVIAVLFGSGRYTLSGTTTRQIIHINGSGSYEASNLVSREAGVRITGSGDVFVNVEEELNAVIKGSGKVRYLGNPLISGEGIDGSGTIERIHREISATLQNLEIVEQLKKIDAVKYPRIEQM